MDEDKEFSKLMNAEEIEAGELLRVQETMAYVKLLLQTAPEITEKTTVQEFLGYLEDEEKRLKNPAL